MIGAGLCLFLHLYGRLSDLASFASLPVLQAFFEALDDTRHKRLLHNCLNRILRGTHSQTEQN